MMSLLVKGSISLLFVEESFDASLRSLDEGFFLEDKASDLFVGSYLIVELSSELLDSLPGSFRAKSFALCNLRVGHDEGYQPICSTYHQTFCNESEAVDFFFYLFGIDRPRMNRLLCRSKVPRSPVCIQPSEVKSCALASGFL